MASNNSSDHLSGIGVILSIALIGVGLFVGIQAVLKITRPSIATSDATSRAVATITSVDTKRTNRTIKCRPEYKFTANGRNYTSPNSSQDSDNGYSYTTGNCQLAKGQDIDILYDPNNPSNNLVEANSIVSLDPSHMAMDIAALPVSLIMVGVGVYALNTIHKARRNRIGDISDAEEASIINQTRRQL